MLKIRFRSDYLFWFFLIFLVLVRFLTDRPNYQVGDRIQIVDRVSSEPIKYSDRQRILLQGLRFYLPLYPEIDYGDQIVVQGEVGLDQYQNQILEDPVLVELKEAKGILPQVRKKLIDFYNHSLPEPHSSLIAGLVLGAKSSLPEDFWQALKRTGTAHVVVASGMNVSLVASFLISFLISFLPRRKAVPLAVLGIWLYAIMAGFEAPIIRAAIMGSIAFSAQTLGKLYQAWRALLLSALLMLIVKPVWIVDLGFILSFVSTACLMLFERKINRLVQFIPGVFREGLSTSIAAQIGVAPILLLTFGQFNLLSPMINALILWTVPITTVIGFISGLVGLIFPFLGTLILYLSYALTSYFVWIVSIF